MLERVLECLVWVPASDQPAQQAVWDALGHAEGGEVPKRPVAVADHEDGPALFAQRDAEGVLVRCRVGGPLALAAHEPNAQSSGLESLEPLSAAALYFHVFSPWLADDSWLL